jgi:SAM-dependent methyltransferase
MARSPKLPQRALFLAGLFLATLATLLLELINTRLLSVVTWYHLSFFAVSTAMFGMAAGAIRVYRGGESFEGESARRALASWSTALAVAIPLSHILVLCIPIRLGTSAITISGLIATTLAIATPFFISGVVVAIALTRIPGPPGLIYAVDLAGAALGSLLVLPLLDRFDISSTTFVCAAIAAIGAICFHGFAQTGRTLRVSALAIALVVAAGLNAGESGGFRVVYSKGYYVPPEKLVSESWSIHGRVVTSPETRGAPWYWGPGLGWRRFEVDVVPMAIDGMAATVMTGWDGESREALEWTSYDVSSLPYHLRKRGEAAVIGVGGGRDLLTALWAESRSVLGVEINRALLDNLTGPFRDFAGIADRSDVTLVHDEARSYFTRTQERFDVLQMSLIDTWAATGAGAFTLSENGLYTLEGWREFLRVLKPDGIFSVSRWYSPGRGSETTRLVALALAALLDRGAEDARGHLILVTRAKAATLLVSPTPFSREDVREVLRVSKRLGFRSLLLPGRRSKDPLLEQIVASRTRAELDRAVADDVFDYSPPTDQRPYFFNALRPTRLFDRGVGADSLTVEGNLLASRTLMVLWLVSFALVAGAIVWPLWRAGLPRLDRATFAHSLGYFALIGAGFMLVQIPLIQRFSVYLGHPTYAVAVILFSMILATGLGSLISDRLPIETSRRLARFGPLLIAAILVLTVSALQPLIDATLRLGLAARCAVVVGIVAVAALPLGFCFPLGLRLVSRLSTEATPWMWGINGAFGVLSSVTAVWISMWIGIDTSLAIAAALYLALSVPATALWDRNR